MKGNDIKTMKILNNLNTTSLISKIKYPFIKIASLFHRVTVANRIQIVENPKYLSNADIHESSKSPRLGRTESFASDITIDEEISDYQNQYDYRESSTSDSKNTDVKEFQDLETFNNRHSPKADPTHLYTRINKRGNGKIDRYVPSEENGINNQTAETPERKNGQLHPFLKEVKEVEMDPPFVPTKNKALRQEVLQRDAFLLKFPRALKEMRLTILKGSELFI